MKMRAVLVCSMTAAVVALGATGCGKPSGDESFENVDPKSGPTASAKASASAEASVTASASAKASVKASPSADPDPVDPEVPNYYDNNRHKWPRDMTPEDGAAAQRIADALKPRLEQFRARGKISPEEIRPVLEQAAGGYRVVAGDLLVGAANKKVRGTDYGIWVGKTGCVTGAVNRDRVWAEVNGRYPEHGCLTPPVGH
ncbi:hypothetical protein [Streptomyces sp. NPDC003077]|uniref:hypothetical protein n=1 Tax=Streptomyces sp. NPDC003077 TaxID=3154443 RepID=UPI0033B6930F